MTEKLWFSGIFRRYRNWALAWNESNTWSKNINITLQCLYKCYKYYKNFEWSQHFTAQKVNFTIKDFFSKWLNPQFPVDLITFTDKILNRKFHFLCNDFFRNCKIIWKILSASFLIILNGHHELNRETYKTEQSLLLILLFFRDLAYQALTVFVSVFPFKPILLL